MSISVVTIGDLRAGVLRARSAEQRGARARAAAADHEDIPGLASIRA